MFEETAKKTSRTIAEEIWEHLKHFFITLGLFTPFSAFFKTFWPTSPKAEMRALITSIALAALTFGIWELWLATDSARLRRFFGLRRDKRLVIAMPSWTTAEGQTLGKRNYETNAFETRKTRKGASTSQWNLDTLTRLVDEQPALRKLRPEYKLDETLFSVETKSPRFLHEHHDKHKEADVTIVSYGASSSNHLCRFILSQSVLDRDPNVYHFLDELNENKVETDYFVGRRGDLGSPKIRCQIGLTKLAVTTTLCSFVSPSTAG